MSTEKSRSLFIEELCKYFMDFPDIVERMTILKTLLKNFSTTLDSETDLERLALRTDG